MTTPALAKHVPGKGRMYEHLVTGELVPSITNIIGVLDKPAIPRWSAKVVAEQAWKLRHSLDGLGEEEAVDVLKGSPWRNSNRAANRGTSIHEWLEAQATGRELDGPLSAAAELYRPAAEAFLADWKPLFVRTEFTVFGSGYGGTGDFMARIDERLVLGDFKTSKAIYPEVALQLAALRHADVVIEPEGQILPVPPVDECVAVLITPKGYKVHPVDAGADAFKAFLACRDAWLWRANGNPIRVPWKAAS